ncbi:MAG: hypothetical protein NVS3B14_04280 [Ktedonobacteraceae bacterium]
MQTYADVITANPSYSAKRYVARLPYAIIAPALGGLALILFFFFLPWFSTGEPATSVTSANLAGPVNVHAITIGTGASSLSITQNILKSDGSGSINVSDSYSFPLIWGILVVGVAQVVLALLVLKDRLLPRWLSLSIRFSFLTAMLFELAYFVSSYFLAYAQIKAAGGLIATFPVIGFWLSILVTIITAIMAQIVIPDLNWCWTLARNDRAREVRYGELRESNLRNAAPGASA